MHETGEENISSFKGHNGEMIFDGAAVTIANKYAMDRNRKGPSLIPLESIESVHLKEPTLMHSNGHIRIVTPLTDGQTEPELSLRQATLDDRTVMVLLGKGGSARSFAERVMQAVRARGTAATPLVSEADRYSDFRRKYGIPEDALLSVGVGGYCAFDGRHLTLQRFGIGRLTVGKGVKRIPAESITAIQLKPAGPIVNGFIQFTVPGGNERRSEFGQQTFSAAGDENSMVFTSSQEATFLALRDAVESARYAGDIPSRAPGSSVLDQIAQLAGMVDSGIVTSEEFEVKKAELLRRL